MLSSVLRSMLILLGFFEKRGKCEWVCGVGESPVVCVHGHLASIVEYHDVTGNAMNVAGVECQNGTTILEEQWFSYIAGDFVNCMP